MSTSPVPAANHIMLISSMPPSWYFLRRDAAFSSFRFSFISAAPRRQRGHIGRIEYIGTFERFSGSPQDREL